MVDNLIEILDYANVYTLALEEQFFRKTICCVIKHFIGNIIDSEFVILFNLLKKLNKIIKVNYYKDFAKLKRDLFYEVSQL